MRPWPFGTTGGTFTDDNGGSSLGSAFDSSMIDVSLGSRATTVPLPGVPRLLPKQ